MKKALALAGLLLASAIGGELNASGGGSPAPCAPEETTYAEGAFAIDVRRYFAGRNGWRGSVLILPPTGGENFIDRSYARALCEAGFDALIVRSWTDWDEYDLALEIHQRFYDRSQRAIRVLVDSLRPGFVGILGTSAGGIHASLAVGHDPRIAAAFVIVGGGPIASIVARSDQEAMAEARARRFERYGFRSLDEYEAALSRALTWNPLRPNLDLGSKLLGMAIAERDGTVPTADQLRLMRFWSPETLLRLDAGHVGAVLRTWMFHSDVVVGFFRQGALAVHQDL